jgi:class 3 adenylate cyclase/tetratricopeptide (TPR) repeat protein
MRCGACGHENRETAAFCESCGSRLAPTCSRCAAEIRPGARFCDACGHAQASPVSPAATPTPQSYTPRHLAEKILASRGALEGERKQVTVLFADVVGSTELIQGRDPEQAQALLDGVVQVMMDAVHRYEGTVSRLMGDGLMALFGAPIAHEDHALRACYAALAMQGAVRRHAEQLRRAEGVALTIRVGLSAGEVVVRTIRDDLHMDFTAMGQTVHLAARMEQTAAPGTIRLTPGTLRLAEGFVEARPLGPVTVKGLPEPLDAFELVGSGAARSRLEVRATRGLTRFVGREAELEAFGRALERAGRGRGQVVALVGEPGVGKSRLVREASASARAAGWRVLETGAVSYGMSMPYLPVADLLRAYFRIEARDDPEAARRRVAEGLLALDTALQPDLPAVLALLDLGTDDPTWLALDPPRRRQQTLEAVRRLLLQESRVGPLLLVFEDLHWLDSESQALLDSLAESLPAARILLLVNYRPEYEHRWGNRSYYTQLRLDPLAAEGAEALLDALLGDDEALDSLRQLLIERTEGNPLFLEESVRTLAETQVLVGDRGAYRPARALSEVEVPATVQAVLAARIDRLPPEDKRLLQSAAVIGKDVPFLLLQAVADLAEAHLAAGLAQLQAAEFLYETSLFPEPEYTFKHALTHDVSYRGLLQERRRTLHARIVEAIEVLHADRLEEQVERLAHHAVRGELREKAVHYLRQAGLKAAARSALPDARAWFEQALGVIEALPESRSMLEQAFEIRLELRPVLVQLGDIRGALEHLLEAEALAERLNDEHRRGRVCAFMTNIHTLLDKLDEALASGSRGLEIAARLGDLRLRLLTTSYLEQPHYFLGDYERVIELATDNLAALPAEWVYEYFGVAAPVSVYNRVWIVMSLAELGRFAESAKYEAEAIHLAEPTQHPYTIGLAYLAAGTLHLLQGDWVKARPLIERWTAVVRAGNVSHLLPRAVASAAWILALLGETSDALDRLREGEQLVERQAASGIGYGHGWAYHRLGRAALVLGRLDEARRLGERAVESSPHHPGFAAHALQLLGDLATHPDRFDAERGEAHYRRALALAEARGMRPLIAHCHLGLGRLHRQIGRLDEARMELSTAIGMLRQMEMTHWLPEAEAELAGLSIAPASAEQVG